MHLDWETFYNESIDENISNSRCQATNISNKNYYISFCFFKNINSSAIVFSAASDSICILVEDTFFKNISSSDYGACFDLQSSAGQVVHNRICSISCISKKWGHYCRNKVGKLKNYFLESSLLLCGAFSAHHGISLIYCKQIISYANISNSISYDHSTFCCHQPKDDAFVNFSSFNKNTNPSCIAGSEYFGKYTFRCSKCNFLSNGNCKTLFRAYSSKATFDSCSLYDNKATYAIYAESSGSAIITNSYVYPETKNTEAVVFENTVLLKMKNHLGLYKEKCDINNKNTADALDLLWMIPFQYCCIYMAVVYES